MRAVLRCVLVAALAGGAVSGQAGVSPSASTSRPPGGRDAGSSLGDRFVRLTRETPWRLVTEVPMRFRTYHPQGMVKIGDALFISSVEVTVRTTRFPQVLDGLDRDAGEGVGHLFKADMAGRLVAHTRLGEGAMYHPGGIDFDGTHIWVPVAEYRPNSRSLVYRVDPGTLEAAEVFRFADHLGAIVHARDDRALHGVSWGSRRFYRWPLEGNGLVIASGVTPEATRTLNPSHYVDYQDCQYAGSRRMLCGGVADLRRGPDAPPFRLGGLDLIDLEDHRPVHQVPVMLRTPRELPMTQNPVWLEPHDSGLRAYFLPEDDQSTLYVYEAQLP